jgi:TldD protein
MDRRQFLTLSAAAASAVSATPWLGACASRILSPTAGTSLPLPRYFEQNFGVAPDTIQKVLSTALRNGGDWADLFLQHRAVLSVGLEDGSVNRASTSADLGAGVRVVVGDQTGYAFTESLALESMLAAARAAAGIASAGARAPAHGLTPIEHPARYPDTDWTRVEVERVIPLLSSVDVAAHARNPLVERAQLTFLSLQDVLMVVDSEGRVSFDSRPMTRLALSVVMNRKGERQSNGWNIAARDGLGFYTPERLARLTTQALHRTRVLFDAVRPPAGEMQVVLAAGSSGILLHEAIGHGIEADFNRKGVSIFAGRIGERVAPDFVHIVDSGILPNERGSIRFDDEGNASESTDLVENGILRTYLHDRISARHYGTPTTGSGRRQSFRHAPMPRMRCTYMGNGPHEREEIFRSVRKGLYCISFTNGQVRIGAGDYCFYVKNGYLIEDGKLAAPVKDVNIIGNGPESLSRITMVAGDLEMDEGGWSCGKGGQTVPVSLGLPTTLVSRIVVGGSAR